MVCMDGQHVWLEVRYQLYRLHLALVLGQGFVHDRLQGCDDGSLDNVVTRQSFEGVDHTAHLIYGSVDVMGAVHHIGNIAGYAQNKVALRVLQ